MASSFLLLGLLALTVLHSSGFTVLAAGHPGQVVQRRSRSLRHHAVRMTGVVALLVTLVTAFVAHTPSTLAASATEIAWEACPIPGLPTQECATLEVPLDYDESDGPTLALAVARVPATDETHRIGSLITSPGGPGGSGVDALLLLYAALTADC